MCKDQLCVKHAKFLSPFLSINHQRTKKHIKPEFLLLDIVLIVKTFWGGSWRVWGGKLPPRTPHGPVDETLLSTALSLLQDLQRYGGAAGGGI